MIRRVLLYIGLIIGVFLLQNNFFAAIHWIDITPNLILIITFIFGFIGGSSPGMIVGFFCGLLSDLFFGSSVGYYALIYTLIGYINGVFGHLFYTESVSMPLVLCFASDLFFGLYVYVTSFLLNGATNFPHYLVSVIIPEIVYTMIIAIIFYKPLKKLYLWSLDFTKRSAKEFV